MLSDRFAVGPEWNESGLPYLGYSDFTLPCSDLATYYHHGSRYWAPEQHGWRVSESNAPSCSQPLIEVEVETITETAGGCGG